MIKNNSIKICAVFLLYFLFVSPLMTLAADGEGRLMTLNDEQGLQLGWPAIDEDIIIWSEQMQVGVFPEPHYYVISNNSKQKIENTIINAERIQIDEGVAVFRNNNYELVIVNLNDETRFNIPLGESKILTPGIEASGFYRIKGNNIVYTVGGTSKKDFYLLQENNDEPFKLFSARVQDLSLSEYNGDLYVIWRYDYELYYCNLNVLDENDNYVITKLKESNSRQTPVSSYANMVLYSDQDKNLYLQELNANSKPQKIEGVTTFGPVHLYDKHIYFVNNENEIYQYDINTDISKKIISLNNLPLNLASNGKDLVCLAGGNVYWYAGLESLKVTGAFNKIKKGEQIELSLLASYRNSYEENVTDKVYWKSSNEDVIQIQNGLINSVSAGAATITAEYEGELAKVDIEVVELEEIELSVDKYELNQGEQCELTVYAFYSDGSVFDVTDEVMWDCKNNFVLDGYYTGEITGVDTITAYYEGKEVSKEIKVLAEDEEEQIIPAPNPPVIEPIPEPKPNPKKSKSKSNVNRNLDNLALVSVFQMNKINLEKEWYDSYITFCNRYILSYPFLNTVEQLTVDNHSL